MGMHYKTSLFRGLAALVFCLSLEPSAFAQQTDEQVFLLSAPPRESQALDKQMYGSIARYLSKAVGIDIRYEHPDNPLLYWENLQRNRYDIVFDESHFIGWLIVNHKHLPLVRVSGALIYVYFANNERDDLKEIGDLAGLSVCGQSPPNQGTLALYEQFDNPFRIPHLVPVEGWSRIFDEVTKDDCDAGIAPLELYDRWNNGGMEALYMTRPVPNQTFSASRRLSPELKSRITAALLSEAGSRATAKLREVYNIDEFERAFEVEYIDQDRILTEEYPFQLFSE